MIVATMYSFCDFGYDMMTVQHKLVVIQTLHFGSVTDNEAR